MDDIILSIRNLKKSFGGVTVLEDINLDFKKGEVHAVLGENGAGKSTLIKIISGYHPPDSGEIILEEGEVNFKSPKDALNANIHTIYQELTVCQDMTVAENIIINDAPAYGRIYQNKGQYFRAVSEVLKELNQDELDLKAMVGTLSVAKRQIVEIAKAIMGSAKIIIMDEPTSSISQSDAEVLKNLILSLKKEGITIIYISHRLQEIYDIADRLTVLRDGFFIGTLNREDFSDDKIISMMVGRKLDNVYPKTEVKLGQACLEVKNLTSADKKFSDISFKLHKGEILGIGGLVGAGRSELLEAIFGMRKMSGGEIFLYNTKTIIKDPKKAIRLGIAFVTEDRKRTGLVPYLSVRENINLINSQYFNFFGVLKTKTLNNIAVKYRERLNIKLRNLSQIITSLSGGNQQKVAVSKWLEKEPRIILFDEPTRGIDIGAKAEIYTIMGELVSRGIAIIMVSSELPELLSVTDRILVMRQGNLVAELDSKNTSQEEIMRYATKLSNSAN
ncbi:MAG: sugar ABC transporter ATP-binding protein [Actinobacteria bacterium]|nr:sugar ABC transporter ATP-binding protein [Actinomycetota bacterium]